MKLRELFEKPVKEPAPTGELTSIGICYGRFNPPHKGHREVWKAASSNPEWFVGTNQATSGPKDPLPYEVKLQCMAAVWPKVAGHVIPEQDLFTMASHIYEKYGESVHLKVYTDEEWLANGLQKYNGQMNQKHGGYKFAQIEWVKTERLASATNLRAAVRAKNPAAFYKDAGVKPDTMIVVDEQSYSMFDVVSHFLNMYPEKGSKVAESSEAKISKRKQESTKGLNTYGDSEHVSGDYTGYRLGMAVAGADGKTPIDMKAKSWIGKKKSTHPYTKEEQDMLKQAYKVVGATYTDLNKGDMESKELEDINTVSAVATKKKNKYGV